MKIELPDEWFKCMSHSFLFKDGIVEPCKYCGMPEKFIGIEEYEVKDEK